MSLQPYTQLLEAAADLANIEKIFFILKLFLFNAELQSLRMPMAHNA